LPKLTGKKKLEFLKRLNKGRIKKGLKAIKAKGSKILPKSQLARTKKASKSTSKPKSKTRNILKPRKRSNPVAKKTKRSGSRRSKLMSRLKKAAIGAILGIAVTAIASRFIPQFAQAAGTVAAATQGVEGVLGKVVLEQAVPQIASRFGFGGNGNGNGQMTVSGFA